MTPVNWVAGVGAALVGLVVCFFGYRLLKVTLGVVGFTVAALLAGAVARALGAGPVVFWIAVMVAGILGVVLAVVLYKVGVFLLGAGAGVLLAAFVTTVVTGKPGPVWLVVGAVTGGIVTLLLQRLLIAILTAFVGAYGVVVGLVRLFDRQMLPTGFQPYPVPHFNAPQFSLVMACWIGLGIVGALVQLSARKKKRP